MSGLPSGWVETTLGEIATTQLGKMLSKKSKTGVGSRPYLRNKNVQWFEFDLTDVAEMDFTDVEFERFKLRIGDLLVCEGGEIGRSAIWRNAIAECCFQKAVHRVRPAAGVSVEFLQYMLRYFADSGRLDEHVTGSTIKHLPQEDLRVLVVGLPPEREQQRIVSVIEEQFSRLDAAEGSLHRARRSLERFRRSAIDNALRGNWQTVELRDVTLEQSYGSSAKAGASIADGVPMLRMGNIVNGALDFDDLKYVPPEHPDVAKYVLVPGDLLFNRTNSPELVGKSAVFEKGPDPTIFASYLIRVRLSGECDPRWAALNINSSAGRHYIEQVRTQQVGQANVNGTKLAAFPIRLPPIDEQYRVIADLERALSLMEAQGRATAEALQRSVVLRRSILERAFTGRLVPPDPNDEPADALLERIRSERPPMKKSRRRAQSSG